MALPASSKLTGYKRPVPIAYGASAAASYSSSSAAAPASYVRAPARTKRQKQLDYETDILNKCNSQTSGQEETASLRTLLQQLTERGIMPTRAHVTHEHMIRVTDKWDKSRICEQFAKHKDLIVAGSMAIPRRVTFDPAGDTIKPFTQQAESDRVREICQNLSGYRQWELQALATQLGVRYTSRSTKRVLCEALAHRVGMDVTSIQTDSEDEAEAEYRQSELQDDVDIDVDNLSKEEIRLYKARSREESRCLSESLQPQFPELYASLLNARGRIDDNKVYKAVRDIGSVPVPNMLTNCRALIHAHGGQWPNAGNHAGTVQPSPRNR